MVGSSKVRTQLPKALVAGCCVCVTYADLHAGEIEFQPLDAESTGIRAIFQRWYDVEMQRQGGPGKSHGWWPWGLRAFDYDGDGDLDLLASHHGTPGSIVLKSLWKESGRMQFADAMPELAIDGRDLPGADDRPWIWDFDGDGHLDIAGLSDESKAPSAFNRAGRGFEPIGQQFAGLSHPTEVIDLDGDGDLDLDGGRKGCWFYDAESRRFRHDTKPRFDPPQLSDEIVASIAAQRDAKPSRFFSLQYLPHDHLGDAAGFSPRAIDLNGDGIGDLVVHGSGGYGAVYLGRYLLRDAKGALTDATKALGLPESGAPILCDDVSGDGRADVLVAGTDTGGLYIQNDDGTFDRTDGPVSDFLRRIGPYLLRIWRADFDNDGRHDLVLSNPRLGRVAVFAARGGGEFANVLESRGWDSNPVVIADFDDDGRIDLAIGGGDDGDKFGIRLYMNRTTTVGAYAKIAPRMGKPNPFAVGAVVEVWKAGTLGKSEVGALYIQRAALDGTPVHVGLGDAKTYDLRVTFPDGRVVVDRDVAAGGVHVVELAAASNRAK